MLKQTMIALTSAAAIGVGFAGSAEAAVMSIGNVTEVNSGEYLLSTGFPTVNDSQIESFLGLNSGDLDALAASIPGSSNATAGSAIKEMFTLGVGDSVSFDWIFESEELSSTFSFYNDFSFVSLTLDGISVLADAVGNATDESGTYSFTASTAGNYQLGIGVTDVGDTAVNSTLRVKNITVEDVPEPASLLGLAAIGAITAGGALKKKAAA